MSVEANFTGSVFSLTLFRQVAIEKTYLNLFLLLFDLCSEDSDLAGSVNVGRVHLFSTTVCVL